MDEEYVELLRNLDHASALIQTGLYYCNNRYDRERYEELQTLIANLYAALLHIEPAKVLGILIKDFGPATPKLGVEAAIFDEARRLLLIRRSDDGLWALPGGWVEVNERLGEALRREVMEEIGLSVQVGRTLAIGSRLAGEFDRPCSACFIVSLCTIAGGEPKTSEEAVEIGFFNPYDVVDWHKDHRDRALLAFNRYHNCQDNLPWN